MPVNPDNDDIFDVPTVYLPISLIDDLTGWDHSSSLLKNAYLNTLDDWYNSASSAHGDRITLLVLNASSSPVDITDIYTKHGYQTGQPLVEDASGSPRAKPAGLGDASYGWIDPPPQRAGLMTLGVCSFDGHSPSFVGVAYGLSLALGGCSLTVAAGLSQTGGSKGWRWSTASPTLHDWTDKMDRDIDSHVQSHTTGIDADPFVFDVWNSGWFTFAVLRDKAVPAQTHTVVHGDTLADLAERYYGDRQQYHQIFDANTDLLDDPSMIVTGQVLTIPAGTRTVSA